MSETPPLQNETFLRLYAEAEQALRGYVRAMLPDRHEASEVMQEVIVTLWQKFDGAEDFKNWAFGVARLKVLQHLQRRQRDRHVFGEELVNQLAERQAELEQGHAAQREALEHCLQKLAEPQREMVLRAYTKGTRIECLAAQRGETAMALYKKLHRIRQALLECVRKTLAQEELA
ncbi:sigma-70 family RNA polymerase sigma factor [Prosthecobacter sp.]|uniref:sigma-70 family RNA polymerase sigma factor n=1 Tax=Prosthecobacter sp. TaxID=1965333 RepID=UPI003783AA28